MVAIVPLVCIFSVDICNMGQTYVERELIKPTPYLASVTVFLLVLFIVLRAKFGKKCPMWIIRIIFILFTISLTGTISILSVFSYLSWMWTFAIVAVVHIPLYLLWLKYLQKKTKKDSLYELGDAAESEYFMDPEESFAIKKQSAFHWAQVNNDDFLLSTLKVNSVHGRSWFSSC